MRVIGKCATALAAAILLAFGSAAEGDPPNPVMTAIDYFSPDDPQQQPLELIIDQLDLSVKVAAGYAETTMVISFRNPTDDDLEGQFVLDLPDGALVTGYGLDIEGQMIPGVIVEGKKAKKAFETRIRERVDPGLGEVTRENAFKNRVFPIFPDKTRTVSVTFTSPISAARPFSLPLNVDEKIAQVSIAVSGGYGEVRLPRGFGDTRVQNGGVLARQISLDGALEISPKSTDRSASIQKHPNGKRFVSISLPEPEASAIEAVEKLRIYWDSSLSHKQGVDAEIAALEVAMKEYQLERFEIVPFANGRVGDRIQVAAIDDFTARLKSLPRNGATNLEKLFDQEAGRSRADVCILVTDGRATIGKLPEKTLPCRLFTLSAASDADRAALALMAKRGGGRFVDAAAGTGLDLWRRAGITLNALRAGGKSLAGSAEWTSDGDQIRILAPIDGPSKTVSVTLDGETSRISVLEVPDGAMLGAIWAGNHLTSLRASAASWEDRVALAQEYSVAGEEGSFLVLETVEDYVEQRIDLPPVGFSQDARATYAEMLMEALEGDAAERDERLTKVAKAWESLLVWYRKDHSALIEAKIQNQPGMFGAAEEAMAPPPPTPPPPPPPPPAMSAPAPAMMQRSREASTMDAEADQLVVVTGTRIENTNTVTVEVREWSPDRPYLKAVENLCDDEFMAEYIKQRDGYGDIPGFYLEMADAAARCGADFASEIALSALELPSSNVDTMAAVASRLMNFEKYNDAIYLYRRIVEEDASRPQPWRDLALALEIKAMTRGTPRSKRRAVLSEALDHLAHVIESPWDGAYDGVELISVIEANRIRDRLQAVGGEGDALHRNLRNSMKFDLRVTAAWNVDEVDMDLWVDEPSGERTMYSNPLSKLGGRLSNDMTNGYGPEEYILRRAAPGTYEVRMNYFRSDIVNPNGAVTLRLHIFRKWGSRNQTMETVDLEFTSDDQSEYLVATFDVEPARVN